MSSKSGKCITFLPMDRTVSASQKDESILQVAVRLGLPLDHTCGGFGTCGTCRIFVIEGLSNLPPKNEIETEFTEERGFSENERLACQCPPVDGLVVEIPKSTTE